MASLEYLPIDEENERSPEEATLVTRLRVFTLMRWVAIFGVIAVTLLASFVFHIGFDTLPVYTICFVMALYNLLLWQQVGRVERLRSDLVIPWVRRYVYLHIILDMAALTVLLHFTGGITNPFFFFFVFHIILASIGLHYRVVYLLATIAFAMMVLLVGLEYTGLISHVNLEGFTEPTRYLDIKYIMAKLASLLFILYATAYMTTAIVGELRKRQREVVQLREGLLSEKTGELERASGEISKLEEERKRFLRFVGITAHDLKAPLTAIQGYIWVMLGGYAGEISDKQKNMLERSAHRITGLLALISDLLDIPRIEAGQIVQEMKETSLRQVIKNSLEGLRDMAKEKGVKIKVELPEGLSRIKGSAPRLQQVVTNLVNNAINYTSEGVITIRVQERNKDLLVEVMDTGTGIPADDMPRLFEDFFRASNVEVKGTGLGLSITKRIVEAHKGKIWAESPYPGSEKGSKFSFTLPKRGKAKRRQKG